MNDLHDLLERASTPPQGLLADASSLLHQGRRRVRRRRMAAGGVACVLALGFGGAALTRIGGATTARDGLPSGPTSYTDLDLTPLSADQVETRCVWRLREVGLSGSYTIHEGTPDQTPRPWHVGSTVFAEPTGGGDPTACIVPDSTVKPTPLGLTADPTQLQRMCGDYVGIDLSGWQPLAADADGDSEEGLFRSGNGYIVDCHAQNQSLSGIQRDTGVTKATAWRGSGVCSPVSTGHVECFGSGRVRDHDATAVDVTLPSGRVVRRPAVDGYWAMAVRDDASGATTGSRIQPFRVTSTS